MASTFLFFFVNFRLVERLGYWGSPNNQQFRPTKDQKCIFLGIICSNLSKKIQTAFCKKGF
jgi:hypothetical protein